jgi:hypothetical protein
MADDAVVSTGAASAGRAPDPIGAGERRWRTVRPWRLGGRACLALSIGAMVLAVALPPGVGAADEPPLPVPRPASGQPAASELPPLAAQRPEAACTDGWDRVYVSDAMRLEAVRVLSSRTAWAAGGRLIRGGRRTAGVLRWDGSGWSGASLSRVAGRRPGDDSAFMGLDGSTSRSLWAVGYVRTSSRLAPLAARRRTGWRGVRVPRPRVGGASLTDVGSRGRQTWAVGVRLLRPGWRLPWVLRRTHDGWRAVGPRLRSGERGELSGVSVSGVGGIWVSGFVRHGGVIRPYVARRAGGGWRRADLPPLGEAVIVDLVVRARDDVWAVGYRLAGDAVEPLVLRRDGTGWHRHPAPDAASSYSVLTGLSVAGGRLTVVGAAWDPSQMRFVAIAARLVDDWQVSRLEAITDPSALMAVGGDPALGGWVGGTTERQGAGLLAGTCAPAASLDAPRIHRVSREGMGRRARGRARAEDPLLPRPRRGLPRARAVTVSVSRTDVRVRDRAASAGLPTRSFTWGGVIADFDGNGLLDVFLGRHGSQAALYLAARGGFRQSPQRFGSGDRHGCAAADVDGSGLPDLFCSMGSMRGTGVKAHQLWLDPGSPAARLHRTAGGALEPFGRGRLALFLDLDGDDDRDLFLAQEPGRADGIPSIDRVYLRAGPADFRDTPARGLDAGLGAIALDHGDVDRDGRQDILLAYYDSRAGGRRTGVRLYRSTGNGFRDITRRSAIGAIGESDVALARIDGVRGLDLVQLSAARIRVSVQRRGRFVTVWERALPNGVALATGDADGDGDTDIYVLRQKSRRGGHDVILLNRGGGRAWRAVAAPRASGGRADDVLALDGPDGTTDFLALNGLGRERGPVQLVSVER